jgi:hypothetical protein
MKASTIDSSSCRITSSTIKQLITLRVIMKAWTAGACWQYYAVMHHADAMQKEPIHVACTHTYNAVPVSSNGV